MKAVVAILNQAKAPVGAFSVVIQLQTSRRFVWRSTSHQPPASTREPYSTTLSWSLNRMGEIWYGCRLCVEHSSELSVTDRNIKMFRSRGQVSVWQSITVLLSSVGSVRRCLHVSDGGEVVGNVLCPNILFLCSTLTGLLQISDQGDFNAGGGSSRL